MTAEGPANQQSESALAAGALHQSPSVWMPRLTRILDEQVAQYTRLAELSKAQSALVREGDADDLLRLLAERQVIVERVNALNEDLAPFTRAWSELLPKLPQADRDSLRTRLDALDGLMVAIAQADDADRAALEQRRSSVSNEINGLGQQRGAVHAYGGDRAPYQPRYQDTKG